MTLTYLWSKFFKIIRFAAVRGSQIHDTSKVESGSNVVATNFDKHTFCGYDCEIVNADIGAFCSIANNVKIGGSMHPIQWVSTSPVFYSGRDSVKAKFSVHDREEDKRTTIGHDVWIGQDALIKQGINIGTGAVVGMGSVVTKDVPPYAIFGGNPAKLIKYRFDADLIAKLLDSKWWEFDDEKLTDMAKFFKDPELFLKELKK